MSIKFLRYMNLTLGMVVIVALGIALDSHHPIFYAAAAAGLAAALMMLRQLRGRESE